MSRRRWIAFAGFGVLAGATATVGVLWLVAPAGQWPSVGATRQVTEFGAVPDDGRDDTDALRQAFAALRAGDELTFPPGRYEHSDVLVVGVPGVRVTGRGATLTATQEQASAFRIDADGVRVEGLTFGVSATSRRFEAPEQQKVWISGHRGVTVRDVSVTGSAAAGIFVGGGAADFSIESVRVSDTRADGIHITGGSRDGDIVDAVVSGTGDDGIAIVSYEGDPEPCSAITISGPQVQGTNWGRGLSVVGGQDIRYTDISVADTDAAGVYIAVEGAPFYTRPVRGVTVSGGTVQRSNTNAEIDHGAVVVYGGRPNSQLEAVLVEDLRIVDTRPTASHSIGVISGGTTPNDLTFDHVEVIGGPATAYGGNAPRSGYRVDS